MLVVIIAFFVFLLMGMPIAFAIGISGTIFFFFQPTLSFTFPAQLVLTQTQSFVLLAIPLFVFAGNLLNESGITKRLIDLATVLTGHFRAGLAQVSIALSTLMGGVTGSAIADASMQARILGENMVKRGYSRGFSAGVIGYSSLIVTMIPPSIGLILYGTLGEVSIGRLFTAGIVPGLLLMLFMMIAVSYIGKKRGYKPEREKMASFKEIGITFLKSIWAFLFPIFLIVGLRFGYFTPSEAGAFAVLYAFLIGILAYRDLTWKKFLHTLQQTVIDIGVIMVLIAMSGIFSYGIVWERIPQLFAEFMLGITENVYLLLIIIVIFLFIAGMFMDSTVLILLLTTILLPVVEKVGVDPVHFGIVMVLTLTIGLLTPPVGIVLFSVSTILNTSIGDFLKESWPLLVMTVAVILLIVFVPDIALFLPNLVFGK